MHGWLIVILGLQAIFNAMSIFLFWKIGKDHDELRLEFEKLRTRMYYGS